MLCDGITGCKVCSRTFPGTVVTLADTRFISLFLCWRKVFVAGARCRNAPFGVTILSQRHSADVRFRMVRDGQQCCRVGFRVGYMIGFV